jgi:hypothetical protein
MRRGMGDFAISASRSTCMICPKMGKCRQRHAQAYPVPSVQRPTGGPARFPAVSLLGRLAGKRSSLLGAAESGYIGCTSI